MAQAVCGVIRRWDAGPGARRDGSGGVVGGYVGCPTGCAATAPSHDRRWPARPRHGCVARAGWWRLLPFAVDGHGVVPAFFGEVVDVDAETSETRSPLSSSRHAITYTYPPVCSAALSQSATSWRVSRSGAGWARTWPGWYGLCAPEADGEPRAAHLACRALLTHESGQGRTRLRTFPRTSLLVAGPGSGSGQGQCVPPDRDRVERRADDHQRVEDLVET
jgi:hypothetical protein